jgi:hypothetical protein
VKAATVGALLLAVLMLGGCATVPITQHQQGIDGVSALRDSGIATVAVGEFTLAPSLKPAAGRSVGARGSSFTAAKGATFADYLREALQTDLRAAGKLDTASPYVIGGELTQNVLNAGGASTGSSTLAARFRVTKSGRSLFDKELRVDHQWESSFIGAIALPAALDNYTEQYSRLLTRLYQDADFRQACKASD